MGPCFCCLKESGYQDALTRKKVGFPYRGLKAGSSFFAQDEEMYESAVETLEKALLDHLIWTGSSHPLKFRESGGVQCFKM